MTASAASKAQAANSAIFSGRNCLTRSGCTKRIGTNVKAASATIAAAAAQGGGSSM